MNYFEVENGTLFRKPEPGVVEVWQSATRTWEPYADYKIYVATAKRANKARAEQIMNRAPQ